MHRKTFTVRFPLVLLLSAVSLLLSPALAETCVTQSAMPDATYNALSAASLALAAKVQANDDAGLRATTISEFATNFSGIAATIASAAPNLKGAAPTLDQVFLLDATATKRNPDGSAPDAQFYCSLNHSQAEADFTIAALPPGRYAFASVRFNSTATSPWLVSMLLRQDGVATSPWLLAGLYPKATVAAGHDGLWYWKQARELAAAKEPWSAYIFYEEARNLLQPAEFVSSTHLENLRTEALSAAPPALSNGIGNDIPLVVKDAAGAEFDFTALIPQISLGKDKLEVGAYLKIDNSGTTVGAAIDNEKIRKRNLAAMAALLHAHPELRKSFAGVWIFAQAPGLSPIPTEASMDEIH